MATDILREFLVDLGFRVDNTSLGKFGDALEGATKAVEWFGATLATTAVTAGVMLERFSSNLEQLYFSAKRVGSSAGELRAFDQAARNFGTTAGEMQGAVEGLAQAINSNPANMGMLAGLLGGVGAHVSSDNVANMANLAKVFQGMPFWLAVHRGEQFGLDYNDVYAMTRPGFNAEVLRQRPINQGITGAAGEAHQFQTQFRDIESSFMVDVGHLAQGLTKTLLPLMHSFEGWLGGSGPKKLGDQLSGMFKTAVGYADQISRDFTGVWSVLKKINTETDGWLGKITLIVAALKVLGLGGLAGAAAKTLVGGGGRAAATAATGAAGDTGLIAGAGSFLLAIPALGATIMAMMSIPKFLQFAKGLSFGDFFKIMGQGVSSDFAGLFSGLDAKPGQPGIDWHSLIGMAPHTRYDNPLAVGNQTLDAGATTTVNQNVTIHIDGARSPSDTGKAVADSLQRLQRNATGVPQ